jgi:beta-aspartyl-peptidase (threonine type)
MSQQPRWGLVIHTGAGAFTLAGLGERREPMRAAMTEALSGGHRILAEGGSSLDAVQATIVVLENSPLFNAGKGAVFTHEGTNELDASIMDGASQRAGAVAGVKRIKNPILLARLVMEKSPHVMLTGDGAEGFAAEQGGIEFVDPKYFHTFTPTEPGMRSSARSKRNVERRRQGRQRDRRWSATLLGLTSGRWAPSPSTVAATLLPGRQRAG